VRTKLQTLAATMYPELIPDIEKVHWLIRDAVSSTKHYACCVGPVGEPKAVLIARVQNNLWALKKSANILAWYSEQPGAGRALMKDFMRWVREDHHVVMAGMSLDWHGDWLATRWLLVRLGFTRRGSGLMAYFPAGDKSGAV